MEDSAHAAQEVLAKRALREYAPQIINGGIMCSTSVNAISNAIAPHPVKGRAAGILRGLPGMDAHALAAERRARQEIGAMVSV